MKYQRNGVKLHYLVEGRGTPILLLHGFTPDHRLMTGSFEHVFRKNGGWKRIYLDLPGMGKSRAPVANADEMLSLLEQFVTDLVPEGPFALAGESYGGYLSRGLLRRFFTRVEGIFLLCPVIIPDAVHRTLPEFEIRERDEKFFKKLKSKEKAGYEGMTVLQTAATWKRFAKDIIPGLNLFDKRFCVKYQKNGYGFSFDVDELEAPFTKPAAIVVGRQDSVVGYEDAWRLVPSYLQASYVTLDTAGHNLQFEQKEILDALIVDWLARMRRGMSLAL